MHKPRATHQQAEARRAAFILPPSISQRDLDNALRYWHPVLSLLAQDLPLVVFGRLPASASAPYALSRFGGRSIRIKRRGKGYATTMTLASPQLLVKLWRGHFTTIFAVEYSVATLWAVICRRLSGGRLVIFQEHTRPLSPVRRHARRVLLRSADAVLANTASVRAQLVNELRVPEAKIVSSPVLVPPETSYFTEAGDIPRVVHRPVFLCVSALRPRKNVALLLLAAATCRDEGAAFSVWIVGDGELAAELTRLRDALELQDIVAFLGAVPYKAMGSFYRACDIFVLPTHEDYRSVSVLEAMRFGKPVLDSLGDGNAGSTVQDGHNGFVFHPADTHGLARAMLTLIKDTALATSMGQRAAATVADLTPARAASALSALVDGDLRQTGPTDAKS